MIIGIDLGTTNSAVAYVDESGNPQIINNRDGERTTPSVILFEDGTPVVGSVAKSSSISDPLNVVQFVKRQMGNTSYKFLNEQDQEFTPEELSAIILKKLKEDAEDALGYRINKAVITVPAYFDDAQRKATQDAGAIAGLDVLKVINEPTAAALAYGVRQSGGNQNVMVYDLGGGTFDVTLMNFNEHDITILGTDGDRNLGGFDFDNKIIEYIVNEFEEQHGIDLYDDEVALQELREKSEACKKTLSNRNKAMINISSQGKTLKVEITKDQFDSMIDALIDRTTFIMTNVLEDAGMRWSDIDKILLVGGSTRVKRVHEAIQKVSGIKPSGEVNPDEVVAIGAALQAYLLDEHNNSNSELSKKIIRDVNSHSLGIAANNDNDVRVNCIVVPRNTIIPCEHYDDFFTLYDNQEFIELEVTEGEDEDIDYVKIIGTSQIKLRPRPAGSPIRIFIGYDENAVVHVRVMDLISNEDLGEMYIERNSNLSDQEIIEKKDKIAKLDIE